MKREFAFGVIFSIIMLSLMPFSVSAHPGRTDSNDGHYNHSTGEYHYHHGYSEHQHYDMDGDGKPDCPFDFVEKTDKNKENKTTRAEESDTTSIIQESVSYEPAYENALDKYGWIFSLLFLGYPLLAVFGCDAYEIIADIKYWRKARKNNKLILERLKIPRRKIPRNVVILEDGCASLGKPSENSPYGKYTVYVSNSGTTFHKNRWCIKSGIPMHIFEIPKQLTPCKRCSKAVKYPVIVPSWYEEIKKKDVYEYEFKLADAIVEGDEYCIRTQGEITNILGESLPGTIKFSK